MGIIRRTGQAGKTTRSKTVVAEGCFIHGELTLEGDLHVDGHIDGIIRALGVSIGKTGVFRGEIYAKHMMIAGRVEGKLCSDTLEMLEGCHVVAEAQCRDLVIEKGAKFVGTSREAMGSEIVMDKLEKSVDMPSKATYLPNGQETE